MFARCHHMQAASYMLSYEVPNYWPKSTTDNLIHLVDCTHLNDSMVRTFKYILFKQLMIVLPI